MTHSRALQEVEALEERLQLVKWTITVVTPPARTASSRHARVVSRTAGLLGKRFARGTTYERRVRLAWTKRPRHLGL